MLKPLTVCITINCGKFWKRWEYQTTWLASWETYIFPSSASLEPGAAHESAAGPCFEKQRDRGKGKGWTLMWPDLRARQSPSEFQKPCSCLGIFFRLHGIREKPKDGKCLHPPEKNCLLPMSLICASADWGEETSKAKMPCRVYLYQR